jgi:hypothetical protein
VASDPSQPSLTARLEEILEGLSDRAFALKLREVFLAAAQCVDRLSDMDLVKYETTSVADSPDLSLWEEMAPVIRDTVMDVNALLSVIREQFPPTIDGGLAETLSRAVDETSDEPMGPRGDATTALQKAMSQIAQQITELGETMRSPSVVSDRWNLLTEIQRFRTRFRQEIGTLVYDSIAGFAEVHPREVVPGYADDLNSAIAVRGTSADLLRVSIAREQKVRDSEDEDIQWHAQQAEKELDTFGRTPAYRALRAQDKRAFVEIRQRLGEVAVRPNPRKADLEGVVGDALMLVRGLQKVSERQILQTHDREAYANTGVRLEQAQALIDQDPDAAARALSEAAQLAQALYGRDPELDTFLRKAKKSPLAQLSGSDLQDALEHFQKLLANIPVT